MFRLRQVRSLFRQGQQRIALGATDAATGMFSQEKNNERENQTETDRKREWHDRHEGYHLGEIFWIIESHASAYVLALWRRPWRSPGDDAATHARAASHQAHGLLGIRPPARACKLDVEFDLRSVRLRRWRERR